MNNLVAQLWAMMDQFISIILGIETVLKYLNINQFPGFEPDDFEIKVYSRWGQIVAQSPNPNWVWNGKILDNPAPIGVYYYVIDRKGKVQNGTIRLMR